MTDKNLITSTDHSLSDAIESFTGFEELEITNRFGADVATLLEEKPTIGMRAIAFVLVARPLAVVATAAEYSKAYGHVMGMSLKQMNAFFPDEVADESGDDLFPEAPVSSAGKPDEPAS